MSSTVTCAQCPLATVFDPERNRYRCEATHKIGLEVVRGNWEATPDCNEEIAKHKKEVTLPTLPLPTTRFEVYALPEKDIYIVYTYKPKYFTPAKYRVRYNGGGHWSCNCPHHQHRHNDFNFIDKHIAAVKQKLASHSSSRLTRETVTLTKAHGFLTPTFMAWLGGAQLGYVRDVQEGEVLANRYFETERDRSVLREKIMASHYEDSRTREHLVVA